MSQRKVVLLNAANMEAFPVYPYAFIQVPAVARRANIEVVCRDLLGVPLKEWRHIVRRMQQHHDPAMFLITLRNTDSMNYRDYQQTGDGEGATYFPIAQTKRLIETIRSVTDVPVTVGGFGFSFLAQELMPILQPDFGVFGGADEFFLYFEDILQGDYRHVANLLYFEGERVVSNKRFYFPPAPQTEYTPQALEEMLAFYEKFPKPGFQGAPVEIMRGCNHSCIFCCEPFVAGRRVQYRDFAVIMDEIELLVKHGVTEIYMIMSELNPEGNDFILRLADRIREFNKRRPADQRVFWFGANYLLTFALDEYQRLYASGFTGGWFDITALDDENARAMRTPYRNESLVRYLQDHVRAKRAHAEANTKEDSSTANEKVRWTMFLGNPATTMETIRRTLAVAHDARLDRSFDSMYIVRPLRVFDYEKPSAETLAVTFSVDDQLQRVPYQQTLPSFAYPPALLEHLGSEEAIERMFAYIGETYLSTAYKETRDWAAFLAGQEPVEFFGDADEKMENPSADLAQAAVNTFLQDFLYIFTETLPGTGLPGSLAELEQMTPYALAVILYTHWQSPAEMVDAICERAQVDKREERGKVISFLVKALLYRFNIRLLPEYKPLFVLGKPRKVL